MEYLSIPDARRRKESKVIHPAQNLQNLVGVLLLGWSFVRIVGYALKFDMMCSSNMTINELEEYYNWSFYPDTKNVIGNQSQSCRDLLSKINDLFDQPNAVNDEDFFYKDQ